MNNYFVTCISNCYEMEEEELLYALALQKAKGIGDVNAKKLIEVCGSAKNVLKERKDTLQKINGIGSVLSKNIFDSVNLNLAEKELKLISNSNIKPLFYLNQEYPKNLYNCIDSPILLFQDGDFNFQNLRIISVVGTRRMTTYGREFCEKLISDLKEYNPIIVSGFAYGVDICAHKSAIENELQTVAVFAHGFGSLYPKAHKKYMAQVYEKGGFLTEFWYNEAALRENFLKRNRIVAGLSQATIVIESASRGGALATATIANSYSRDVFAVPGRSTDICSQGCNALIRDNKAALITNAEDLVKMLNWKQDRFQPKIVQKQLFVELTDEEQKVMDYLSVKKKELLDVISLECDLLVHKTASVLFQLEMKGLVRTLPGKLFELI